MSVLADAFRRLADEIEWLDDQGSFPRKLSWLAVRAREIAEADDATAAQSLLEEPDFYAARKAAEADVGGYGKTWAGRAITFLTAAVRALQEVERRVPKPPPPPSVGTSLVESETREEHTERRPRPTSSIITTDDET